MLVRFYIRNRDGSIEGDETTEFSTLERIEKGMTVLGRRKTLVVEFDPPLRVARNPEGEERA
jgi:hypothetical protein